jgi:hypothetical protein
MKYRSWKNDGFRQTLIPGDCWSTLRYKKKKEKKGEKKKEKKERRLKFTAASDAGRLSGASMSIVFTLVGTDVFGFQGRGRYSFLFLIPRPLVV